jgi:VWA domain-containing protein
MVFHQEGEQEMCPKCVVRFLIGLGWTLLLGAPLRSQAAFQEAEPNDRPAQATSVQGAFEIGGDLQGSRDWYRWSLSAADAGQRWRLVLQGPAGAGLTLSMYDEQERLIAEAAAEPDGRAAIDDLGLAAGTWLVRVGPEQETPLAYSLTSVSVGARSPDREEEPDDSFETARPLDVGLSLTGCLTPSSGLDMYRFAVDEEHSHQRLEIELASGSQQQRELCLRDAAGRRLQCRSGAGGARLVDLALAAGGFGLSVSGAADPAQPYTIRFIAAGAPAEAAEREPDDSCDSASPLPAGISVRGRLAGSETDVYRLVSDGPPQLWRIEAEGEGIGRLAALTSGCAPEQELWVSGQKLVRLSSLYWAPGEHFVSVSGSGGGTVVRAMPEGPPQPGAEIEPNDDESRAQRLRFAEPRTGRLDRPDDRDLYRFFLAAEQTVAVRVELPQDGAAALELHGGGVRVSRRSERPGEALSLEDRLPAGDYHVVLAAVSPSEAPYRLSLERVGLFSQPKDQAAAPLEVELTLDFEQREVAAYRPEGQRVEGRLRLRSAAQEPVEVALSFASSDLRWVPVLERSELVLQPGGEQAVPVSVLVPPDAWAGEPVRIAVQAQSGGRRREAEAEFLATPAAAPLQPHRSWPLPEALLGGLDAAWTALGAVPNTADPELARAQRFLHDEMTPASEGFVASAAQLPLELTVRLAGDASVPVAGALLHPQPEAEPGEQLDGFDLELSEDGSTFRQVLTSRLDPLPAEQAFVLPEPVSARFARLRLRSIRDLAASHVRLGEWKVVVRPGVAPWAGAELDLADPARGGHVVWTQPQLFPEYEQAEQMLTEKLEAPEARLRSGASAEWVLGFHQQRAAQLVGLEWTQPAGAAPERLFGEVEVSVSTESPVGPWTGLGRWDLRSPDPAGGVRSWRFDRPVWARYLRFVAPPPGPSELRVFPDRIRVLERPTDGHYRSILGEWGHEQRPAVYEALQPSVPEAPHEEPDAADEREAAAPLQLGQLRPGEVQLGRDRDWYAVDVPAGANTLRVHLREELTGGVRLRLEDAAGKAIALSSEPAASGETLWKAAVEAGQRYFLLLEEPLRSVVFVWDTSPSVAPWLPVLYSALGSFVEGVSPGVEGVNLLPFGGGLLLPGWSDQPQVLQRALNDDPRRDDSSEAEAALLQAVEALRQREGVGAVLLLTDAWSPAYRKTAELWQALAAVRPRIFVVAIGSTQADTRSPRHELELMQSWASVNAGHLAPLRTQGALDVAFERASTWLRRPVRYALLAEALAERPPGPGHLEVVRGKAAGAAQARPLVGAGAVELILDASGSMLQTLQGRRRIDIAKQVLTELVERKLPRGVPLALRVFGHRRPGACDTELLVAPRPLEPAAVARAVAGIRAVNLAKTPIAESLRLAAADLASVQGPKLLVLVTDGAETCGGDPQAEIRALAAQGLEVRLNIVGFAVEDAALEQEFARWAGLGGGRYFDAAGAEQLSGSLEQALRPGFEVLSAEGRVVASGQVDGPPVELAAGVYRVRVSTNPPQVFERVEVEAERAARLEVADGP